MKRLIVLVLAIVSILVPSQAQLLLSTGQSYDFEFSTLTLFAEDLTGINPPEGYNFATFDSDVTRSTPGATFTVRLFENSASEAPIASMSGSDFVTAQTTGGWHDLQGVARVTVDSGTVFFETVQANVFRPTPGVPGSFEYWSSGIVPVPEPDPMSLGALGLLLLMGWNFRRRKP